SHVAWNDGDRHSGCIVGNTHNATVPGQADPARQGRCEIVRMALEVEPECEQLLGIRSTAGRSGACHEAERDRRRARAETTGAGNAFGKGEAEAVGGRKSRESADGEMIGLGFSAAFDELELVPEVECGAGAVEPRPEVRGGGRRAHVDHEPGSGIRSSAPGSLSP